MSLEDIACRRNAILVNLTKLVTQWEPDGRIHWVKRAFPEDVELLLFDDNDDETEQNYVEAGEESDESDVDES